MAITKPRRGLHIHYVNSSLLHGKKKQAECPTVYFFLLIWSQIFRKLWKKLSAQIKSNGA